MAIPCSAPRRQEWTGHEEPICRSDTSHVPVKVGHCSGSTAKIHSSKLNQASRLSPDAGSCLNSVQLGEPVDGHEHPALAQCCVYHMLQHLLRLIGTLWLPRQAHMRDWRDGLPAAPLGLNPCTIAQYSSANALRHSRKFILDIRVPQRELCPCHGRHLLPIGGVLKCRILYFRLPACKLHCSGHSLPRQPLNTGWEMLLGAALT